MKRIHTRDQRLTIVYGMLGIVLVLVVLQLWLLTATMDAYLGGIPRWSGRRRWPAWPACCSTRGYSVTCT